MRTQSAPARSDALGHSTRLLLSAGLIFTALFAAALAAPRPAFAAGITVTTTADEYNAGTGCSLREAITAANTNAAFGGCPAGSGADTISLPAGTFQITINPGPDENANAAGDFDLTSALTINGAGAANTIINAANGDRIFDIAPLTPCNCAITLAGLTIQNGKAFASNANVGGAIYIGSGATVTINDSTLANNQSQGSTGGAIENRGALTLNTVTLQNNTAFALGGAINSVGPLTVTGSAFTGNKAESGGAIYINTASGQSADIGGSVFSANQAVTTAGGAADNGGAIAINTQGAVSITGSSFTGNSSSLYGGAVSATAPAPPVVATLTMNYNRITGNVAASGSGIYLDNVNNYLTATVARNWWGCNAAPSAAPCDTVIGVTPAPWIRLSHTATPNSIPAGQSTTLTADFLKNSDGSANAAGNLGAFVSLPVAFGSPVLGTISNAQASIQANGAATATYTAGATAGAGSAAATVGSATATANITITQPPIPPSVMDLTASLATAPPSNAVTLKWSSVGPDAQHYEVWRAFDAPYFTPEAGGVRIKDDIAPASTMTYTDPDAQAATPGTAVFYLVLGVNSAGQPSTGYNRAGAMVFGLQAGLTK